MRNMDWTMLAFDIFTKMLLVGAAWLGLLLIRGALDV
jgi:hypothetical protein